MILSEARGLRLFLVSRRPLRLTAYTLRVFIDDYEAWVGMMYDVAAVEVKKVDAGSCLIVLAFPSARTIGGQADKNELPPTLFK